uniref:Uncharacterized protein n=1 Tax=Lactuca sativa TaxID=4236 RepID=A0A9R1XWE0_LACSA|nr:hypothetical protein LSAT_V11C100037620 [Lactuca sativa]
MLIVSNCIGLVEVGESIEQCIELVFINLSYCKKLKTFPKNIGMLKNVKTLLLDGCKLNDFQIEDRDMVINIRNSSSSFMNAIPSDLKLFTISLLSCMRNLSRLEILSIVNRKKLKSVEHPPHTLSRLFLFSRHGSFVKNVVFDPECPR